MRSVIFAAVLAATIPAAVSAPAFAQSYGEQQRWDQAQARYQRELSLYQQERDRYFSARDRDQRDDGRYPPPRPPVARNDDRDENGYDPSRYYRPGREQQQLASDDRVYRGSDGKYYCKRSDGTTGLIIGAATGGILGNVIDGGHSRTAGTLLGGALGALAGKSIDQNSTNLKCQ